jgi:2-iminoacetate synthase ThiH
MVLQQLYEKALRLIPLDTDEGVALYTQAPVEELMFVANLLRQWHNPGNIAGWMIDRNVNIYHIDR